MNRDNNGENVVSRLAAAVRATEQVTVDVADLRALLRERDHLAKMAEMQARQSPQNDSENASDSDDLHVAGEWQTGMPNVGDTLEVELVTGERVRGKVSAVGKTRAEQAENDCFCLTGPDARPECIRARYAHDFWVASHGRQSALTFRRWRNTDDAPKNVSDSETLPDGWRWGGNGAYGPRPEVVFIDDEHLEFQYGCDSAPLAVVRAVIARHDRLKGSAR